MIHPYQEKILEEMSAQVISNKGQYRLKHPLRITNSLKNFPLKASISDEQNYKKLLSHTIQSLLNSDNKRNAPMPKHPANNWQAPSKKLYPSHLSTKV